MGLNGFMKSYVALHKRFLLCGKRCGALALLRDPARSNFVEKRHIICNGGSDFPNDKGHYRTRIQAKGSGSELTYNPTSRELDIFLCPFLLRLGSRPFLRALRLPRVAAIPDIHGKCKVLATRSALELVVNDIPRRPGRGVFQII
jgi:hypothetical protein